MKVIDSARQISERGVQLLKEQPGWKVVLTDEDTLSKEIVDADCLIVRSANESHRGILNQAEKLARGRPARRGAG